MAKLKWYANLSKSSVKITKYKMSSSGEQENKVYSSLNDKMAGVTDAFYVMNVRTVSEKVIKLVYW